MVDSVSVLKLFDDEEIKEEFHKRKLKSLNDFNDYEIEEEFEERCLSPSRSGRDFLDDISDEEIKKEHRLRFNYSDFMDAQFLIRNKMFEDLLIVLERNYPEFDGITSYKIVKK